MDSDRSFDLKVRLFIVLALVIFGINAFADEGVRPADAELAVAAKSHLMTFLINVGEAGDFREKSEWTDLMKKITPQISEEVARTNFGTSTAEESKNSVAEMMLVQVEGFAVSLLGSERMIVEKTESRGANQATFWLRPYPAQSVHTYELRCSRSIESGLFGPSEKRSCKIEKINKSDLVASKEEV